MISEETDFLSVSLGLDEEAMISNITDLSASKVIPMHMDSLRAYGSGGEALAFPPLLLASLSSHN